MRGTVCDTMHHDGSSPRSSQCEPEHEDRQGEADDDAGEEADERHAEGEQGRVDEVLPERRGVAGALRLDRTARRMSRKVRQRRVVGAGRAAVARYPARRRRWPPPWPCSRSRSARPRPPRRPRARPARARVERRIRPPPVAPTPPPRSRLGPDPFRDRRDDVLAVGPQRLVLERRAAGRWRTGLTPSARSASSLARCSSRVPMTQNRSTISSGTNVGMRVAGPAVLVVVVALAALDVVGERRGHVRAVGAVTGDDVGDVVADHARRTSGTGRRRGRGSPRCRR